ncbi:class I SAM-dependent methyltransferase [Vibrio alfacsensis]
MRSKIYRFLYNTTFPFFPNTTLCQYLKWKAAILLVGDEFHKVNLDKNRTKLAKHFVDDIPLQQELVELVKYEGVASIKVLDVGAGPVSKVGKTISGKQIELVPIDPMADKYRSILESLGLTPKIWTIFGNGEELSQQFPAGSFDLAHARNSVDHCLNPLKVLIEVLSVLKPGCCFYMNHYRNEGKAANYYGLHQWDFDIEDGCFVIKSQYGDIVNVNNEIAPIAEVRDVSIVDDRIIVILRKL